tara:strand:- start:3128 stop:3250 length:123 start_codon:yes stop_codon:yes gene_type:complete
MIATKKIKKVKKFSAACGPVLVYTNFVPVAAFNLYIIIEQ